MTIKEFAKLCNCNPQTLRYYDKEDLLKPIEVDSWTGYRYYSEEQAIDFVKIKNLQEADFSIKEIKELLSQSDEDIYQAFKEKIAEQEAKLERIRKIQATYLSEKHNMEVFIKKMQERVMASARKYDPTEEFGITEEFYKKLIDRTNQHFADSVKNLKSMKDLNVNFSDVEIGDEKDVVEEEEYLTPLENDAYVTIYEKHNWENAKEVLAEFPKLEDGEYILYYEMEKSRIGNMMFCNVNLGYVLEQNEGKSLKLACNVTNSEDDKNHFWLLKAK